MSAFAATARMESNEASAPRAELIELLLDRIRRRSVENIDGRTPAVERVSVCALEGLPAAGKSTLCRFLSPRMVSAHAGADTPEERTPRLRPDQSGRFPVDLRAFMHSNKFFLEAELARSAEITARGVGHVVLDRSWISQIAHTFAVCKALALPPRVLSGLFSDIENRVSTGALYFPDWALVLEIDPEKSFRKVVHRDGDFFNADMKALMSGEQRAAYLGARAEAYDLLGASRGLPLCRVSSRAHPADKLRAALTPACGSAPDPFSFFESYSELLLLRL